MFKKNDGGQAFPTAPTEWSGLNEGMSLRDYFAAKAMQSLLAAGLNSGAWSDYDDLAKSAWSVADAMLKARDIIATVSLNGNPYTVRHVAFDEWELTMADRPHQKSVLNRQQMQIAGLGHVVEGGNG